MDWMEIGSGNGGRRRVWPAAVVTASATAGIAVSLFMPVLIPRGTAANQAEVQEATETASEPRDVAQDKEPAVDPVEIDGIETLTGLTAEQASQLPIQLAGWMTEVGMDPDSKVVVTKEPTTKGGATTVKVAIGDPATSVECSWHEGSWVFTRATEADRAASDGEKGA